MSSETNTISQIESISQVKESVGAAWKWKYWNDEIQNAITNEKDFVDDAEKVIKIYKSKNYSVSDARGARDVKPVYNILYSNIETLKPLVFSRLPNPRIRRRNLEKSNVNKLLSILLERNVKRILEDTNAQVPIEQARNNYLLVNRGVCKVIFNQEIIKVDPVKQLEIEDVIDTEIEATEQREELGEKEIKLEFVSWRNVLFSPAETWEDVCWVSFRHKLTQQEIKDLKKKLGIARGKKISLEEEANSEVINDDLQPESLFKKAEVWEIWDKRDNKIKYWSAGYQDNLLGEVEDSYKLKNFFNIPRPLGIDSGVDDVNYPISDYTYYERQAQELDRISNRIMAILPYISMGGGYNSALTTTDADNFLRAIDVYHPFKGPPDMDINKMIYERDIAKLASVLQILYEERQQTITAIQEISGISDIVRGQTDSKETATAQTLKGNYAISRIQPKQKEVEFFCRDIIRIIVELIAENFDTFELAHMAQMKVHNMDKVSQDITEESHQEDEKRQKAGQPPMSQEEREQFFAAKFKPYQNEIKTGQATTINLLKEANKILKDDKLRGWAIEVETDSTIKVDQDAERQSVLDFADAIAKVSQDFLPALQEGIVSKDAFKAILSYIMRRFDGSEEVEELLADEDNQGADQAQAQAAQMQQQMMQKEVEFKDREVGVKEFTAKSNAEYDKGKLEIDREKLVLDESKAVLQAHVASENVEARSSDLEKRSKETKNEQNNSSN